MELQGGYDDIRKQGLGLVAISYDSHETLKAFAASRGITFPPVSDPGSAIIKRYGILNEQQDPKARGYGVPHPGTFIVDRRGRHGAILRKPVSRALYRGYGESGGTSFNDLPPAERQRAVQQHWPGDIDAAFDFLISQPGVDRFALRRRSCGDLAGWITGQSDSGLKYVPRV